MAMGSTSRHQHSMGIWTNHHACVSSIVIILDPRIAPLAIICIVHSLQWVQSLALFAERIQLSLGGTPGQPIFTVAVHDGVVRCRRRPGSLPCAGQHLRDQRRGLGLWREAQSRWTGWTPWVPNVLLSSVEVAGEPGRWDLSKMMCMSRLKSRWPLGIGIVMKSESWRWRALWKDSWHRQWWKEAWGSGLHWPWGPGPGAQLGWWLKACQLNWREYPLLKVLKACRLSCAPSRQHAGGCCCNTCSRAWTHMHAWYIQIMRWPQASVSIRSFMDVSSCFSQIYRKCRSGEAELLRLRKFTEDTLQSRALHREQTCSFSFGSAHCSQLGMAIWLLT